MRLCAQWGMSFEIQSDSDPDKRYRVSFDLEKHEPRCECKAFEHSKTMPKTCKHIICAMRHACLWSETYAGGDRTLLPSPKIQSVVILVDAWCPRCGGPVTETVAKL